MDKNVPLACLSETDMGLFADRYGFRQLSFIPCFLPWQKLACREGKGAFCLYHGNLGVSENEEAARWLIEQVFSKLPVPLVIAGKGISPTLKKTAGVYGHIRLISNPTIAEINQLVSDAHIHVLPSLNNTGVKLKLLNALFNGRFCLTNTNGVMGSRIEKGILVQDEATRWISAIESLMHVPFSGTHREERTAVLSLYNNRQNAEKLSELLTRYQ